MRTPITIIENTDDELRVEIVKLCAQIPYIWRGEDGTNHHKNFHIEHFIRDKDRQWLLHCIEDIKTDLEFLKSHPKNIVQRDLFPPIAPRKKKTLQAMLINIGGLFKKWFHKEYHGEPFDKNDLDLFDDYLKSEWSIRVRPDGLIEFWVLNREAAKAIGDLPVVLFHYTSSALSKAIKAKGLLSGMESINGRKADGVYLTTETSGPAIRGYALRARSEHGGNPVCVIVKAFLNELEPDPDDEDISSGRHQFRVDHVLPDRIIKIERAIL